MSRVIGLVPARLGSKGCPGKNLRVLGDLSLIDHALRCARRAHIPAYELWLTTDYDYPEEPPDPEIAFRVITRPSELAQDDTPMIAVVQHALQQIPGQPDDIIVLLQPTQPFRKPEHIRTAIALLQESGADSVVSVVPLPLTHSPDMLGAITAGGRLKPWNNEAWPTRRQQATSAYMRDGTVYCFRRETVERHGTIYGKDCRPLILDPSESCELDTELDWAEVVARWERTHG